MLSGYPYGTMAHDTFAMPLPAKQLRIPLLILVVLATGLLLEAVTQVAAIRAVNRQLSLPTPTAAARVEAPAPAAAPALASLATSELFGHFDPQAAHATEATTKASKPLAASGDHAPSDLPEATLGLSLQGVVYRATAVDRRAIIAGGGPTAEAHRIGDTLSGDATIRFIEARRVVVEQNGELKALTFAEPVLGNAGATKPRLNVNPAVPNAQSFMPALPQAVRRGAVETANDAPQPYEEPSVDELDEPPPGSGENGAADIQGDVSADPDLSEPTE